MRITLTEKPTICRNVTVITVCKPLLNFSACGIGNKFIRNYFAFASAGLPKASTPWLCLH